MNSMVSVYNGIWDFAKYPQDTQDICQANALRNTMLQNCEDGSVVKREYGTSAGPKFESQHPGQLIHNHL